MTPEGKVKDKVKDLLKHYGCWYYMPVPGGYGAPTLDFICSRKGRIFCIETKAPGKKATPRQRSTMKVYEKYHVPCRVEDGSTLEELEAWILMISE